MCRTVLSDPRKFNSLRWIGIDLLEFSVDLQPRGVHTPEAVIKTLLAGASAVEICRNVYRNKNKVIRKWQISYLWMDKRYDK